MQAMTETERPVRRNWGPTQFVRLPENRSARHALRRLARTIERHRPTFTPILLIGPPGCGKSHLLDDFASWASEFVAVRRLFAHEFPSELDPLITHADLVLIDDLPHLPLARSDVFCSWWDKRLSHGRATVVTSTRSPADLPQFPPRLTSRLVGSLLITMPSLTSDSRRIVLQRRLPGLSAEALDWLAHHTPGSMRQLLGIIAQLASLPTTDLTPTRLANWFRDHDAPRSVDGVLDRIVARVAAEFQLDAATLTGRDRRPTVAKARQLCIYLARNWTSLSFDQLSHYFRRDESTLRHAYQQLATTRPRDETLSRSLDRIESDLLLWIN